MTAPAALLTIADLDAPVATLAARLAAGHRADNSHLLHDADPDAVTAPFPYLIKTPRAVAR